MKIQKKIWGGGSGGRGLVGGQGRCDRRIEVFEKNSGGRFGGRGGGGSGWM